MENNNLNQNEQNTFVPATAADKVTEPEVETNEKNNDKSAEQNDSFKFFKSCSTSLKRFSVIMFVINLFVAIAVTGVVVVTVIASLGTAILSLLALPLVTLFVLLVLIARFISALIYGFAVIVEKHEK